MATNPRKAHGQPLPVGLERNGLAIWHQLSDKQKKIATEYCSIDAEYYHRFCTLLNDRDCDPMIIERGGVLSGLSHEGKKVWDILETDVQLEIFITSSKGHIPDIRKFINAVWEQHAMGRLTLIQIEHGIQTLTT